MPLPNDKNVFVDHVVEMMQTVGPVNAKRMFGGHGIFLEGLMFGLIAGNDLYLKVDDQTRDDFLERGLEPFSYYKKEKEFNLSYYQAPEETLEQADAMREWGNRAYEVALRAASTKRKKPKRK
ncbi:MAG: TfoX/Sxy family protein [Gammaproteobacteria bacterium]|jgi:DNA transformation protein and related proteins